MDTSQNWTYFSRTEVVELKNCTLSVCLGDLHLEFSSLNEDNDLFDIGLSHCLKKKDIMYF